MTRQRTTRAATLPWVNTEAGRKHSNDSFMVEWAVRQPRWYSSLAAWVPIHSSWVPLELPHWGSPSSSDTCTTDPDGQHADGEGHGDTAASVSGPLVVVNGSQACARSSVHPGQASPLRLSHVSKATGLRCKLEGVRTRVAALQQARRLAVLAAASSGGGANETEAVAEEVSQLRAAQLTGSIAAWLAVPLQLATESDALEELPAVNTSQSPRPCNAGDYTPTSQPNSEQPSVIAAQQVFLECGNTHGQHTSSMQADVSDLQAPIRSDPWTDASGHQPDNLDKGAAVEVCGLGPPSVLSAQAAQPTESGIRQEAADVLAEASVPMEHDGPPPVSWTSNSQPAGATDWPIDMAGEFNQGTGSGNGMLATLPSPPAIHALPIASGNSISGSQQSWDGMGPLLIVGISKGILRERDGGGDSARTPRVTMSQGGGHVAVTQPTGSDGTSNRVSSSLKVITNGGPIRLCGEDSDGAADGLGTSFAQPAAWSELPAPHYLATPALRSNQGEGSETATEVANATATVVRRSSQGFPPTVTLMPEFRPVRKLSSEQRRRTRLAAAHSMASAAAAAVAAASQVLAHTAAAEHHTGCAHRQQQQQQQHLPRLLSSHASTTATTCANTCTTGLVSAARYAFVQLFEWKLAATRSPDL
jgi:hypothetical protein